MADQDSLSRNLEIPSAVLMVERHLIIPPPADSDGEANQPGPNSGSDNRPRDVPPEPQAAPKVQTIVFDPVELVVDRSSSSKNERATPDARAVFTGPSDELKGSGRAYRNETIVQIGQRTIADSPQTERAISANLSRRGAADSPFDDYSRLGHPPSSIYSRIPFGMPVKDPAPGTRTARKRRKAKPAPRPPVIGKTYAMGPAEPVTLNEDDKKILEGLRKIRDDLYTDLDRGRLKERDQRILLRLESFYQDFEAKLKDYRSGDLDNREKKKFDIAYVALLKLVDPTNGETYGAGAPYQRVDRQGNVTWEDPVVNHCNHLVYDVVKAATEKGLSARIIKSYGMLAAGEYFSDDSETHLSESTTEGELGDIIAFGPEDEIHSEVAHQASRDHVGIYLGDGLYISATETGRYINRKLTSGVSIADVYHHAHFREVN